MEIVTAAKPGVAPLKRTGMAPGAAGLGLGTAGPSESNEKSCAAPVAQVVIRFVRQEKLSSIGLSPGSTQQPTHEASFYMDPLPSQTFSTLIKLEMQIPHHGAKYCQDKCSQLSLTLDKDAAAEFICCRFWECSY